MSNSDGMLYKATDLAVSLLGSVIAGKIFNKIWSAAVHDSPPSSTDLERPMMRDVLPGAVLHGAILGVTRAVLERGNARGFRQAGDRTVVATSQRSEEA
jgi:hypothetical protein